MNIIFFHYYYHIHAATFFYLWSWGVYSPYSNSRIHDITETENFSIETAVLISDSYNGQPSFRIPATGHKS